MALHFTVNIDSLGACLDENQLYGISSAILHIDVVWADSQAIITLQKSKQTSIRKLIMKPGNSFNKVVKQEKFSLLTDIQY